jgi:hypothetical protein
MPIGPITPGTYVDVTPDASPAPYTSIQAPTATMPVIGADIQELTLKLLNVQVLVREELADALAAMALLFETEDLRATTVFDVRSGQIHAAAGAIQIGGGADVITVTGATLALGSTALTIGAAGSFSSSGTNVFGSGSDTSFDGTAVVKTTNGGKFRWDTRNKSPAADYTADGTNGYEDILLDPPADRAITLADTGAAQGQRKKFNAQNVTSFHWVIAYGARTWFLKNATGSTVKIEFVFDGSGWVVDDWEEGGSALRNG